MLTERLRIGIVGCGRITQVRHAPEYAENKDVEIVGFFDFVTERAEELARKYGGRAFASAEELLACDSIDAVSICTPNDTHEPMALLALAHGKHVLCEKPMEMTIEKCENMLNAAKASGKRLMIAHNQRLFAVHKKAKELLSTGVIGSPILFKICFGHSGPDAWSVDSGTGNWFFNKSKNPLGVISDLGVHKIDLVHFLLDERISELQTVIATLEKKDKSGTFVDVIDNAIVSCRMESGVIGTASLSWTYYGGEKNDTVIYGSLGKMEISVDTDTVSLTLKSGDTVTYRVKPQKNSGVIDDFVGSIKNGEKSVMDAEKILPSMKAVFASVESAKDGRRVKIY